MDFNLYIFPAPALPAMSIPGELPAFEGDLAQANTLLTAQYGDYILIWDPMLKLYRQPEKLLQWSTDAAPLVNIFYMPASGMAEYAFFEDGDQSRWVSFDLDGTEAEEMAALGITPDLSQTRTREEGEPKAEEGGVLDPILLLKSYGLSPEQLPQLEWKLLPSWPVNN